MKKIIAKILTTGIVLSMCAATAFIARPAIGRSLAETTGDVNNRNTCICADADLDNACEGYGKNFVDEDGDGVCDNKGSGQGRGKCGGKNFVDEDGDGVCDNKGAGQGCGERGSRGGHGKGAKGGCGRN